MDELVIALQKAGRAAGAAGTAFGKAEEQARRKSNTARGLGSVYVRTARDAERLRDSVRSQGREFGLVNGLMRNQTAQLIGLAGSYVGVLAAVRALQGTVDTFTEFSQSLSGVLAVTQATQEQFESLEEQARLLGATTIFSASEAASGMEFLGRAGFEANEIISAMPGLLDLAAAGQLDLGRAADITSNIMAGFNIAAEESNRVADILAATAASSNTNVEQLGEAMKFVAPVAAAAGQSIEFSAAAVGVLSDAGLQASLAGTGLRQVMAGLISPTREAQREFQAMGLTASQLDPSVRPLVDILDDLARAGLDAGGALSIAQARGGPALLALVSGREKLRDLTRDLHDAEGAAMAMADTMQDNLAGDSKAAQSALAELQLVIGEELEPTLRSATQELTNFLRSDEAEQAARALGGALTALVEIVAALTRNWELLALAFAGLKINALIQSLGGLNAILIAAEINSAAWGVALLPIAGLIAGIGAAALLANRAIDEWADDSVEAMNRMVQEGQQIREEFERIAQVIDRGGFDEIGEEFDAVGERIQDLRAQITEANAEIINLQSPDLRQTISGAVEADQRIAELRETVAGLELELETSEVQHARLRDAMRDVTVETEDLESATFDLQQTAESRIEQIDAEIERYEELNRNIREAQRARRAAARQAREDERIYRELVDQSFGVASDNFSNSEGFNNIFAGAAAEAELLFETVLDGFAITDEQLDALADELTKTLAEDGVKAAEEFSRLAIEALRGIEGEWGRVAIAGINAWQAIFQEGDEAIAALGAALNVLGSALSDIDTNFGNEGGALGSAAGAAIGSQTPLGAEAGAALGQGIGSILGSLISKGVDEGLVSLSAREGEFVNQITKNEGGLGDQLSKIANTISEELQRFADLLGGSITNFDIGFKQRGDELVVFILGLEKTFQDAADAVDFVVTSLLTTEGVLGGDISPEVRTALQNTAATTIEQLERDLGVALEEEALKLGGDRSAIRDVVNQFLKQFNDALALGLDGSGGLTGLVSSFSDLRNSILGVEESVEERIRREAAAFEAERQLAIARLAAEEADLLVQQANLQAQVQITDAQADVYRTMIENQGIWAQSTLSISQSVATTSVDIASTVSGALDAVRNAIANLQGLEITEGDIQAAIASAGGGGGRRQAREAFRNELRAIAQSGQDEITALFTQYNETLEELAERQRRLNVSTAEYDAALAALNDQLQRDLRELGQSLAGAISPMAAFFNGLNDFIAQLQFLQENFATLGLTADQVGAIIEDGVRSRLISAARGISDLIDDEELLAELRVQESALALVQYQFQLELLRDFLTPAQQQFWDSFLENALEGFERLENAADDFGGDGLGGDRNAAGQASANLFGGVNILQRVKDINAEVSAVVTEFGNLAAEGRISLEQYQQIEQSTQQVGQLLRQAIEIDLAQNALDFVTRFGVENEQTLALQKLLTEQKAVIEFQLLQAQLINAQAQLQLAGLVTTAIDAAIDLLNGLDIDENNNGIPDFLEFDPPPPPPPPTGGGGGSSSGVDELQRIRDRIASLSQQWQDNLMDPVQRQIEQARRQFDELRDALLAAGGSASELNGLYEDLNNEIARIRREAFQPIVDVLQEFQTNDPRNTSTQNFFALQARFNEVLAAVQGGELSRTGELAALARELEQAGIAQFGSASGAFNSFFEDLQASLRGVLPTDLRDELQIQEDQLTTLQEIRQLLGGDGIVLDSQSAAEALSSAISGSGGRPGDTGGGLGSLLGGSRNESRLLSLLTDEQLQFLTGGRVRPDDGDTDDDERKRRNDELERRNNEQESHNRIMLEAVNRQTDAINRLVVAIERGSVTIG